MDDLEQTMLDIENFNPRDLSSACGHSYEWEPCPDYLFPSLETMGVRLDTIVYVGRPLLNFPSTALWVCENCDKIFSRGHVAAPPHYCSNKCQGIGSRGKPRGK